MRRMEGKVAVVVGGASGFGYACAKLFATEGAEIVIAGRRGKLAEETAAKFQKNLKIKSTHHLQYSHVESIHNKISCNQLQ